jgi:hypothetical protein
MARFSNDIQEHEVRSYEKFCIEQNIILDGSQAAIENANLVRDYFTQTWNEVITPETLEKALPQLRPHLKFKSKVQLEFEKLASQEPDRASELDRWLQTQGKPGQLVNSLYSDETYENLTLLLTTLRGYDINSPRIRDAENRIAHKPGRKLHYVQAPRREMGTITEAARKDDGAPFLGRDLVKQADVSYRSKTPAEQRRDREAAEQAERAKQSGTVSSVAARDAQMKAEQLRGNTHSESEQIARLFVTTSTNEIDWVQTLAARLNLQKSLNKTQEVRRFIR